MEIPQGNFANYIQKAMNDEFKVAGLYSGKGNYLIGEVVTIEHYVAGLNDNYWEISMFINARNGHKFTVSEKYKFSDFYTCNAAARELVSALQDLFRKIFSSSDFAKVFTAKSKN